MFTKMMEKRVEDPGEIDKPNLAYSLKTPFLWAQANKFF